MSQANTNEVLILLELYKMATSPEMREARTWILTEFQANDYQTFQQDYPNGSLAWRRFTDVCGVMELFGLLVKRGLVQEDLFFDLFGGIDILWETVANVIPGMRRALDPRLYSNFEFLYRRFQAWQQQHSWSVD